MVDRARDISFETFSRHVDWRPLAQDMGYATERGASGMKLENDRCATFHSSTWRGEHVYYMVHSAIEFVFRRQSPRNAINPSHPWTGMERVDTTVQAKAPSPAARPRRPRP